MSNLVPLKVITEHFEETNNRLTAASSKENIRPFTKMFDEKLESYLASSQPSSMGSFSFNHNPFKNLSKQNDEYTSFQMRVHKEFAHLKRTRQYVGATYRFPISNNPVTTGLAVNAAEVSPLLQASEERLHALENEMDLREKDFIKVVGMMDILMEENKYLRDHISTKSREFLKILDTIGYNDGESVGHLKSRVNLLTDENNILKGHLEQYKNSNVQDLTFTREKAIDYEVLLIRNKEYKESLEEALKREEDLANYRQAVEPKFRKAQNQIVELEAKVQELEEELVQVNSKLAQATNHATNFKKRLQEVENKSSMEITRLTYDVDMLRKEKDEIMKLIEDKKQTDEENENQLSKMRKDLQVAKLENEEMVQTVHHLRSELTHEKFEGEVVFKRESEVKERNKQLSAEIERLQKKIVEIEDEHKTEIETLKTENLSKQNKSQQKIEKLKLKLAEENRERDSKISTLEIKLKESGKYLSRTQQERDGYIQRLNDVYTTKEDVEQREQIIIDYEYKVRDLQQELKTVQKERDFLERRTRENPLKTPQRTRRTEVYDPTPQHAPVSSELTTARRDVNDVEKENDYLRLLLKNSVEEEKPARRSHSSRTHRPSSVTPAQRDSHRHDGRSSSNMRSSYREPQRDNNSGTVTNSRVEDGLTSYRTSVKTLNTRKTSTADMGQLMDESDIERVVGSVMKKYNLREVPDFMGQKDYIFKAEMDGNLTDRLQGRRNAQNVPILPLKALNPLSSERFSMKDTQASTEPNRGGNGSAVRSLPMSPDKDHKGAQKSIIQEIDDDDALLGTSNILL